MNKNNIRETFRKARESNAPYVFVKVSIPGCSAGEMIINKRENFDFKENFYINTYNDKLEHNHNNSIKIEELSYGDLEQLKLMY